MTPTKILRDNIKKLQRTQRRAPKEDREIWAKQIERLQEDLRRELVRVKVSALRTP